MDDFGNIRTIRNFINVSNGKRSRPIKNVLYEINASDRYNKRRKQVKRRKKAWEKHFNKGIFSILGNSGPFQDPNTKITEQVKQENRLIHRKNKKINLFPTKLRKKPKTQNVIFKYRI